MKKLFCKVHRDRNVQQIEEHLCSFLILTSDSLLYNMHSYSLLSAAFVALAGLSNANPMHPWGPPPPPPPPQKSSGFPGPQSWPGKPGPTASTTSSGSSSTAPASPSCSGYFEPLAPPYLNDLARSAGKLWFGSATDQPVSSLWHRPVPAIPHD